MNGLPSCNHGAEFHLSPSWRQKLVTGELNGACPEGGLLVRVASALSRCTPGPGGTASPWHAPRRSA